MTDTEQQEIGFAAGVQAYRTQSPYALSKVIKSLKAGAWGDASSPYSVGFLHGASEQKDQEVKR